MHVASRALRLSAIGLVVVAAACAGGPGAAPTPRPPTDANIAAMLLAANNTDISYAQLVPTRSDRDDVKQFAQRMVTDHTGVNQLVNDLLAKLALTPVENIASLDMADQSADKRDVLRELSGHAFDSAYMANEVSYHTKLLKTIDSVLAPNAHDPQLKELIAQVRPAVAAHLEHAQRVQAAGAGGKHHVIRIAQFAFQPSELTVAVGDTIEWINADILPHTTTADGGAWGSPEFATNARFLWIAVRAGRYPYHCTAHPTMTAVLVAR